MIATDSKLEPRSRCIKSCMNPFLNQDLLYPNYLIIPIGSLLSFYFFTSFYFFYLMITFMG